MRIVYRFADEDQTILGQVYLAEYTTGSEARAGISWWMDFYNQRRPHSSLADRTPDEAYTPRADLSPESTLATPLGCPNDGVHL